MTRKIIELADASEREAERLKAAALNALRLRPFLRPDLRAQARRAQETVKAGRRSRRSGAEGIAQHSL